MVLIVSKFSIVSTMAKVNTETGVALTNLSVSTGSASSGGTLAYNDNTGVFTMSQIHI